MANPDNKERPNRSETTPRDRDRERLARELGKRAVASSDTTRKK